MRVVLLLADHAAVADGKLYINGGGWSRVPANTPFQMGLAVKLEVPWDQTNIRHHVVMRLVDADGAPVPNPDGQPILLEAAVEVGRPPGLKHGVSIDAPMAVNIGGVQLTVGAYRWEVIVNDEVSADASIQAEGVAS